MKKAQSVMEYCVMVLAIVIAILAMRIYIQRSMQGRFKELADSLGKQHDPALAMSSSNVDYDSLVKTETKTERDPTDNKLYTITTTTTDHDTVTTNAAHEVEY